MSDAYIIDAVRTPRGIGKPGKGALSGEIDNGDAVYLVPAGRNAGPGGDADVSAPGAAVRTLVVHAREDVVIARAARRVAAVAGGAA